MDIDLTKFSNRTKGNFHVRNLRLANDGNDNWPIIGEYKDKCNWYSVCWDRYGLYVNGSCNHPLDLVEIKEKPMYMKKIRHLIEDISGTELFLIGLALLTIAMELRSDSLGTLSFGVILLSLVRGNSRIK